MPRNKQIFIGRTIGQWSGGEINFRKSIPEMEKWVAARINQGMITTIDPADIPKEALQLAKNAKVVFDKTSRRDGVVIFGPAKPDSNPVLKMASIKEPDGSGHTYRFTPSTINDLQAGVWNPIAETVPLAGTANDRFQTTTLFDVFVFTNNGANNVQRINPTTDICDDLFTAVSADIGTAPFRYCTNFSNRVVVAAQRGINEILIAWSARFLQGVAFPHNLDILDPIVDETSGFSPLVESPSDVGDFITGVFNLTSLMAVARERSMWVGVKQAQATNPYNLYSSVPGVGADSPFSIKVTAYGLAWLDRRSRTVYSWTPGSFPEPIGRPVEKSIISNITDPNLVFGAYDTVEDAYSVMIPAVGSTLVRAWTFYFREKAWTYNEFDLLSSYDDVELLTADVQIDDLIGLMGTLVGTYDSLNPSNSAKPERIYGFSNGDIAIADPAADTDRGVAIYETDLISGVFMIPEDDVYIAMIVIRFSMSVIGDLNMFYSLTGQDNGPFILGDSFVTSVSQLNKPQIITFRKVIDTREFAWRLTANAGRFDILSYEVWVYNGGQSSMVNQN